jgi:DnaJ-class molecular chaperone
MSEKNKEKSGRVPAMDHFDQIDEARKILGLAEDASMEEIKNAFRTLALLNHPDKCPDKDKARCEENIKRINNAKDTILAYCANYRFSFRKKDAKKNTMSKEEYDHLKRFYDGWWGDLDL